MSFYILTSNPQIIRGNMENWKITRFGHASKGKGNTRINNEIRGSLSRKRITVSLQYIPKPNTLTEVEEVKKNMAKNTGIDRGTAPIQIPIDLYEKIEIYVKDCDPEQTVDKVTQELLEMGITATDLQIAVKHLTKKNLSTY